MIVKSKIGIGIITCNRPKLFLECIKGIPNVDFVVIVNDGEQYPSNYYPSYISNVFHHKKNIGVGRSKNQALKYLLEAGCEHIFLCEDDIKILNPDICNIYIKASEVTGIKHFNFAYHGPRNKDESGNPSPRLILDYDNGVSISLNKNLVGAFSYYRKEVLQTCGLMDPLYKNMMEHVDHTNKIIKRGFHPPFWWFADINGSHEFIKDLDPDLSKSSIKQNSWLKNKMVSLAVLYFAFKNGYKPWNMPDTEERIVRKVLENIKNKYSLYNKKQ